MSSMSLPSRTDAAASSSATAATRPVPTQVQMPVGFAHLFSDDAAKRHALALDEIDACARTIEALYADERAQLHELQTRISMLAKMLNVTLQ